MAEVKLAGLTKRFGKKVWAVRDFDLTIEDREFLVLLGPSGCGKTTTLRMVAGLEQPTAGTIHIGDQLVNLLPPRDRDISMVFQSYAVWPHMKVRDNIAFGLRYGKRRSRQLAKDEVERVIHEVAGMVRIEDLLDRFPTQLSGGQRQRVALARALAVKPQVFLYDEPLSNLDAKLRIQMRTELKYIHEQAGATSIYVTHDQAEAMSMANRIMVMELGRAAQLGTPDEIYFEPASEFVGGFIGTPPMCMFNVQIEEDSGTRTLVSPYFTVTAPEDVASALDAFGRSEVLLGIRPEDVLLTDESTDFRSEVFVLEPQGPQQIACFRLDEATILKSLVSADVKLSVGQEVGIRFNPKRYHLFEPETGKRLN